MPLDPNLKVFLETMRAIERQRGSRICCMIHRNAHMCRSTPSWLRTGWMLAGIAEKLDLMLYSPAPSRNSFTGDEVSSGSIQNR